MDFLPGVFEAKIPGIYKINNKLTKQDGKVIPEKAVEKNDLRGYQAELPENNRRDHLTFIF
jgi:hypothetical protein